MRKIIFAAVIFSILGGCASDGSFMGIGGRSSGGDGSNVGTREPSTRPWYAGVRDRFTATGTGAMQQYDDRIWPPVVEGQAFPPQHMDAE
jgi:hypothetical protein